MFVKRSEYKQSPLISLAYNLACSICANEPDCSVQRDFACIHLFKQCASSMCVGNDGIQLRERDLWIRKIREPGLSFLIGHGVALGQSKRVRPMRHGQISGGLQDRSQSSSSELTRMRVIVVVASFARHLPTWPSCPRYRRS